MKPKLLIISQTIRRDLHAPLRLFSGFEITHCYQHASYGDMGKEDFNNPPTIQYTNEKDLYKIIYQLKPKIIQTAEPWANKMSFIIALTTYKYAKKNKVKVVMPSFENIPLKNKLSTPKFFLCQWIIKRLDPLVSVYFILNNGAQNNLESLGIKKEKFSKLMWASWGIDSNEFKSIPQIKNQKSKIKNLLFLGRVSKAKGIPQLLKMFEEVQKEVKDAKLIIAGPAGDASHLIPKTCTYDVQVFGTIKNVDTARFFNNGAVTIMPSQTTKEWEEQVGMVGLQSMACGTPVITTTSGAIPEYFKNNNGAFLFKENDYEGMAKICIKLLSDEKFHKEQSQKAIKYISENYEVKNNIKKIQEFLLKL